MRVVPGRWFCLLAALLVLPFSAEPGRAQSWPGKVARGQHGMVATGSPYATNAGVSILEAGGNAVDAAAAACFALTVTDPAMTSLGGRVQIVIVLEDGRVIGVDGATEAPAGVPPLAGPGDQRDGYRLVPVPGLPAALAHIVERYGNLSLAAVLQPAIELAERGFVVPRHLGEIWESLQAELAANPGGAANYLKPDGAAFRAGEFFRQPRLAALLRQLAESGPEIFYHGPVAEAIARDVRTNGGFIEASDLRNYRPLPGAIVRTNYRGYEVVSQGRHAWGNTLIEMLNILDHFTLSRGDPTAEEVELLARIISQSLADRPQRLGSLEPKDEGFSLELLSSREFARKRAAEIRARLGQLLSSDTKKKTPETREEHDTTHMSVIDAQGNAVALTTSIGPRFGRRLATPELGFLYAHSYRMKSRPTPGERDLTEMTPTIVLKEGKPLLAVGAAGSARIPGAILQVISNVVDRGYPLEKAVAAPRVYARENYLRLHEDFSPAFVEMLRARGFDIDLRPRGITRHLGIMHAVLFETESGEFVGVADPAYDGTAAGPRPKPLGKTGRTVVRVANCPQACPP